MPFKFPANKKRTRNILFLIFAALIQTLAFQNCSSGFEAIDLSAEKFSSIKSVVPSCSPTQSQACSLENGTGIQYCNSSGAPGICQIESCASGYILQNGSCAAKACTANATTACAQGNGTGSKTCDSQGISFAACLLNACDSGFTLQNGLCIVNPSTPPIAAAVKFHGRFDLSDPSGPRYSWPGSSMSAQFSGSSVSVTLKESDSKVYYAYVIDQQPMKRISVAAGTNTYNLATGLSDGVHKILLMRDTEGSQAGPSQFLGFSFGGAGRLLAPPDYPNKYRLEFVGDSFTAGYGNLGVAPCTFSTETESAFWSYAQQTALNLGEAPATNISFSGIGIFRNYGQVSPSTGSPSMPFYYPRIITFEAKNFVSSSLQPTVVVINLGTNDFWNGAPTQSEFTSPYQGLVKSIRSNYPTAMIIMAIRSGSGPSAYVQSAFNQIRNSGESRIRFVELPMKDMSGCSGHPSKAADLEAAAFLARYIQDLGL